MSHPKIQLNTDTFTKVSIDFMNNTHFEEIDMVKHIADATINYTLIKIPSKEDKSKITALLQQWLEHTKAHFERENKLMLQTLFPAYEIHSGEHANVLQQMQGMTDQWQSTFDIDAVIHYVFDLWPAWFEMHVNSMDMMTAQFAVNNGFNPEDII